ncbi:hypothetical protein fugu_014192 [Takifugu bimaculatus]|uniref:Protein kinase domain-containing protein n=1 Tax=Takifugu bimaculatus TaxID=433685 RepID=A0A4Z2C298_9TELE|nr:hypothetical protein fugu_014192 [Takifugu bimaculatus]
MEPSAAMGCVNICNLTSNLPVIPYQKLTDLYYLSRGGFGTVFKAQHSDWRTTVAIKCLKLDSPVGERERNCLLKEAEVLHKARFNHIIQILGICNEPEFFCIVTEYMSNGSLDLLLHQKDVYPSLGWPLRLRILYEISLGVNFLHNMNPPLLHHDLKTQNILLDGEFHVKISASRSGGSCLSVRARAPSPQKWGEPVIYMPPERYDASKNHRADVKHDMYSFSIIMWEVLSRQIPFEEVTNPMQIMFSVLRGMRPEISLDKCLVELEPMVRAYDEIDFLEAVLEIKRSQLLRRSGCCAVQSECQQREEGLGRLKERPSLGPVSESSSGSGSDISLPGPLTLTLPSNDGLPSSLVASALGIPESEKDIGAGNNLNGYSPWHPNIPMKTSPNNCDYETRQDNVPLKPQPHQQGAYSPPSQGPIAEWIATQREEIVAQMTEACLNQSLDALLARSMLMREDYELVRNQQTRTAKVRQLLDHCHRHNEDFCRIVVRKLHDNKQMNLKPYPTEIASPTAPLASAPPLSLSCNITRNV